MSSKGRDRIGGVAITGAGRGGDALRRAIPEAVSVLGSRRRAAGGGDLLFFAESERGVRSAQAETATTGRARAEARVESACPRGAAAPGPARDLGE